MVPLYEIAEMANVLLSLAMAVIAAIVMSRLRGGMLFRAARWWVVGLLVLMASELSTFFMGGVGFETAELVENLMESIGMLLLFFGAYSLFRDTKGLR
jgi:hypothetical protein